MRPVDEMYSMFAFEIEDQRTFEAMERWLHVYYPEAEWKVTRSDRGHGTQVTVKFNSPHEQTFYMLKWA
jgi:hypothetical protein